MRSDNINTENIKKEVQEIINHYKTNDVYKICDYLRINILENDLGCVKGIIQYYRDKTLFHVNQSTSYKDFYIGYLLGHYFFNFKPIIFSNANNHEAFAFATELLLTDEVLFSTLKKVKTLSIEDMSQSFHLPVSAIKVKLKSIPNSKIIFPRL